MWFQTLQFCSQSLGGWRRRRKGLANIMIDPNLAAVPNTTQIQPVNEIDCHIGLNEATLETSEKEAS